MCDKPSAAQLSAAIEAGHEAERLQCEDIKQRVNACCDRHDLQNEVHSLRRLLDHLEAEDKEMYALIFSTLCKHEGMNASCFIRPAMLILFKVSL